MSTRVRPFTHVYIFEAGPYCKVGATSNMRQRMKDMRCYAMQYVCEAPVLVAAWEVSDAGAIEAAVRSLIGRRMMTRDQFAAAVHAACLDAARKIEPDIKGMSWFGRHHRASATKAAA